VDCQIRKDFDTYVYLCSYDHHFTNTMAGNATVSHFGSTVVATNPDCVGEYEQYICSGFDFFKMTGSRNVGITRP